MWECLHMGPDTQASICGCVYSLQTSACVSKWYDSGRVTIGVVDEDHTRATARLLVDSVVGVVQYVCHGSGGT